MSAEKTADIQKNLQISTRHSKAFLCTRTHKRILFYTSIFALPNCSQSQEYGVDFFHWGCFGGVFLAKMLVFLFGIMQESTQPKMMVLRTKNKNFEKFKSLVFFSFLLAIQKKQIV